MAGSFAIYRRNYDTSDTTEQQYGMFNDPSPTIDALGWSPPSGYIFEEWNSARDGSGIGFQPGTIPMNAGLTGLELIYAIWTTPPVPYLVTDKELISVADAIRSKGGTSAQLSWPTEYVEAIGDIQTGGVLHTVTNNLDSTGVIFDYDTMSNVTFTAAQREAGERVTFTIAGIYYVDGFQLTNNTTGESVPYGVVLYHATNGLAVTFTMPDGDVTLTQASKPVK